MRRRSHLAAWFVALLMVSWSVVTTEPRGLALAADPEAELARTRELLADARSTHQSLQAELNQQRAELAQLQRRSADLDAQLDLARAELAAVTAEHDRVGGLLEQVRVEITEIEAHLAELHAQIDALDAQLLEVANDIRRRSADLEDREALLQDHLRAAYERSQTSLLEVILSADSLDEATTQVGYLLNVSDQDVALAEEIRSIRAELEMRRETLADGRRVLSEARKVARDQEDQLHARQAELAELEAQLAELKVAADQKRAEQEAALNASLQAEGDVEASIADNERAAQAATELANRLQSQAAAQQAAIEEARRRAAEEAARRAAEQEAARRDAVSSYGFRWPEDTFRVTQEWGPTSFVLEPPYNYKGTYYPHFHGGIDFANGCGTPIHATGPGVVVASGQPLAPWDSGYGVVIDHGSGMQSWYWHMQPRVIVSPGQIVTGQSVIGYEGTTGMSTGCHVHFAINHHGWWENPRNYLP
ncbi:MAG: murein hydrolase activator EnvC family protein [Candidatus Limnocylindria bacterium]